MKFRMKKNPEKYSIDSSNKVIRDIVERNLRTQELKAKAVARENALNRAGKEVYNKIQTNKLTPKGQKAYAASKKKVERINIARTKTFLNQQVKKGYMSKALADKVQLLGLSDHEIDKIIAGMKNAKPEKDTWNSYGRYPQDDFKQHFDHSSRIDAGKVNRLSTDYVLSEFKRKGKDSKGLISAQAWSNIAPFLYGAGKELVMSPIHIVKGSYKLGKSYMPSNIYHITSPIYKDPRGSMNKVFKGGYAAGQFMKENPAYTSGTIIGGYWSPEAYIWGAGKLRAKYHKWGSQYIEPEKVYDWDVLREESIFPKTHSPEYSMDQFLKTKDMKKYQVTHTTSNPLSRETKTIPGKHEKGNTGDIGLYVTPKGRASPWFLKTTGSNIDFYNIDLSAIKRLGQSPRNINVAIRDIKYYPKELISEKGFHGINKYMKSRAGKSEAYISKRSTIGDTHELEAVVPPETPLKMSKKGTWLQKLKGNMQYTKYNNQIIPIYKYHIPIKSKVYPSTLRSSETSIKDLSKKISQEQSDYYNYMSKRPKSINYPISAYLNPTAATYQSPIYDRSGLEYYKPPLPDLSYVGYDSEMGNRYITYTTNEPYIPYLPPKISYTPYIPPYSPGRPYTPPGKPYHPGNPLYTPGVPYVPPGDPKNTVKHTSTDKQESRMISGWQPILFDELGRILEGRIFDQKYGAESEGMHLTDNTPFNAFYTRRKTTIPANIRRSSHSRLNRKFRRKGDIFIEKRYHRFDRPNEKGNFNIMPFVFGYA